MKKKKQKKKQIEMNKISHWLCIPSKLRLFIVTTFQLFQN